ADEEVPEFAIGDQVDSVFARLEVIDENAIDDLPRAGPLFIAAVPAGQVLSIEERFKVFSLFRSEACGEKQEREDEGEKFHGLGQVGSAVDPQLVGFVRIVGAVCDRPWYCQTELAGSGGRW